MSILVQGLNFFQVQFSSGNLFINALLLIRLELQLENMLSA